MKPTYETEVASSKNMTLAVKERKLIAIRNEASPEKVVRHTRVGGQFSVVQLIRRPLHDSAVHAILLCEHPHHELTVQSDQPFEQCERQAVLGSSARRETTSQMRIARVQDAPRRLARMLERDWVCVALATASSLMSRGSSSLSEIEQ